MKTKTGAERVGSPSFSPLSFLFPYAKPWTTVLFLRSQEEEGGMSCFGPFSTPLTPSPPFPFFLHHGGHRVPQREDSLPVRGGKIKDRKVHDQAILPHPSLPPFPPLFPLSFLRLVGAKLVSRAYFPDLEGKKRVVRSEKLFFLRYAPPFPFFSFFFFPPLLDLGRGGGTPLKRWKGEW